MISSGLGKVDETSSQFRISLVAYAVDAMKVRAKEVAVTKIMTAEPTTQEREKKR